MDTFGVIPEENNTIILRQLQFPFIFPDYLI